MEDILHSLPSVRHKFWNSCKCVLFLIRASKLKLMVYNLNAGFSFAHTNKRSIKNNEIPITNKLV